MTQKAGFPSANDKTTETLLHLRVLATTDVHGNILSYDYFSDRPLSRYGLARIAPLIRQARTEMENTLLFDNGDFLQGTPLSDLTALELIAANKPHPVISAMNALEYDAVGLGNHEFNFGLENLFKALKTADFPITCANLARDDGTLLFPPYHLLHRRFRDTRGNCHNLTIGVIGLVPPQTTIWDKFHLTNEVRSFDILETAHHYIPEMRAAGADIVIALSHTGIAQGPSRPMMENAALPLGAMAGIDAIVAGHTHQVFPSDHFVDFACLDVDAGTLNRTPAVMAGARGSHLGMIDLTLTRRSCGKWSVTHATSVARAPDPAGPVDDGLQNLMRPAHARTLALTSRTLGTCDQPLCSYLALVAPCASVAVVTRAQSHAVRRFLKGTPEAELPVLSASAPFKTGARGGPDHFTHVPRGPICLRHAADLCCFPNVLCVLRMTGADIRDWLERSAIIFNRIVPGLGNQHLLDREVPGHHFDVIDGVSYQIDLSEPARYDLSGRLADPSAYRIKDLSFNGRTVQDNEIFLMATNNFRVFGGGPFLPARPDQLLHTGTRYLRDLVADYIRETGNVMAAHDGPAAKWAFCAMPGTEILYDTSPAVRDYPDALKKVAARDLGNTPEGFARLGLAL